MHYNSATFGVVSSSRYQAVRMQTDRQTNRRMWLQYPTHASAITMDCASSCT